MSNDNPEPLLEFPGKLIQKILWKFSVLGHEQDRFTGKLNFSFSRCSSWADILQELTRYSNNFDGWVFQWKGPTYTPKKQIDPEFEKMDDFSSKTFELISKKTGSFEKNWMSFPEFDNKGSWIWFPGYLIKFFRYFTFLVMN